MKFAKRTFQIFSVLAICMHIMAGLSPIWASAASFEVTICSGDTFKTIAIDENGQEIPQKPKLKTQKCSVCAASNFTALPADLYTAPLFHGKAQTLIHAPHTLSLTNQIRLYGHPTRAPPHKS